MHANTAVRLEPIQDIDHRRASVDGERLRCGEELLLAVLAGDSRRVWELTIRRERLRVDAAREQAAA